MIHTRWTQPNMAHESALQSFVATIIKPDGTNDFLREFISFQERIAFYGMINGLSQTLLKITSPGVPDFYQGSDLWDLRLVDPDNRQLVDFDKRDAMLGDFANTVETTANLLSDLARNWRDGRVKLYLIWKALHFRIQNSMLFSEGEFLPMEVSGKRQEYIAAFARRYENEWILIAVPRWLARGRHPIDFSETDRFWKDTQIELHQTAPASWSNVLTGEDFETEKTGSARTLPLNRLLKDFPVALLSGRSSSTGKKETD
jgi:(1->4)-alpha-D-glucan 1-alpha-D-glucosylmutase